MEEVRETSTSPVQSVLENPVEPRKKFSLKIIILLIVILLVAGGVYAGMQIGRKQTASNEIVTDTEITNIPVSKPTVVPTIDETANWKTYRNEKYGFEMKYPDNWIVNIADDSIRFQTFPEPSPGYGGFPGGKNDIQISLSVKANSEGLDLEKFFAKQSLGRIVKSKQSIVLGNISGIIATYDEEVGAGMSEVYSVANNFLIEGIVFCGSNDVKEKAISIFDQILSTFKFLD